MDKFDRDIMAKENLSPNPKYVIVQENSVGGGFYYNLCRIRNKSYLFGLINNTSLWWLPVGSDFSQPMEIHDKYGAETLKEAIEAMNKYEGRGGRP